MRKAGLIPATAEADLRLVDQIAVLEREYLQDRSAGALACRSRQDVLLLTFPPVDRCVSRSTRFWPSVGPMR